MSRLYADLTTFTFASDYDSAHYKWDGNELAALGDCKVTAEVIKARLESNGLKIKEMYIIEHNGADETPTHFHILVKFEPTHGATLQEIAEYIGVLPNIIEKPKPGGHSYDNMLAYLIHIKYTGKVQYAPEDVITLAGTDYMDYYNERSERWEKARERDEKYRPLASIMKEAIARMEKGEIAYSELRGVEKYRKLLMEPKYARQLKRKDECIHELSVYDWIALRDKIEKKEITSLDEIVASKEWKLAYKYHKANIESALKIPQNM